MILNDRRLTAALSTIHKDERRRHYTSGKFTNLLVDIKINIAAATIASDATSDRLRNFLAYVHQDFWNLKTIVRRLHWQKGLIAKGRLDEVLGSKFAECDIDLFHVQYRSLFDYLAKIIALISDKPGQVKSESFEKLYIWADAEANVQKMGEDLAQLVKSCDWFKDLREVRNSIVHSSGQTIVFPEKNRILFQIEEDFRNKINIPFLMFNENIVDFELYAGLLVGNLMAYLEEVGEACYRRLNLKVTTGNVQSFHGALPVIKKWIERVSNLKDTR